MQSVTKAPLEVLVLEQSLELKKLRKEGWEARKILLTFRRDYHTECQCDYNDNFHCLPCRISDWLHKYESVRKNPGKDGNLPTM